MLATLAVVAIVATVGCGNDGDDDDEAPGMWQLWRALEFEARADLPVRASVRMSIGDSNEELLFETTARATLMGLELSAARTRTFMDRETGRPREFVSLTRRRGRRYRFEQERYVVERLEPTAGFDAPATDWTVTSAKPFPYPPSARIVYDYYGMIFNMRRLALDDLGDRASVWVSTSDGPSQFEIVVEERRETSRTLKDPALEQPVTVTLEELRLRITPLEDASDVRGFLGMRGETEIWVEAKSKTLTEVRGNIRRAGAVVIELTGIEWR